MLSKRQAEDFRARLAAGERITLRARVAAKMVPATFDVVVATIPGTEAAADEVVLTAHLCHESAGANDNASGSAAILEIARALQSAIRDRTLAPPRRTIRFLWLPEIAGSQAYLVRHPEVVRRLVAGIHMDMVGGLLATTKGTFHLSRSAASLPHAVNDIARAWFDDVVRSSARFAERGGNPYSGLVWPPGSREVFLGDIRPLEMGSDHEVFEEASFRVPMVYFHDWPDVTIHTNKDQPENLDPTKLGRVAYLGAGIAWTLAALPDTEAPRLLALVGARNGERIAAARARAVGSSADGALFERESVAEGVETLRSVAALFPSVAGEAREAEMRLASLRPAGTSGGVRDNRVPARSPDVRGPLGVYYYDHLSEVLGPAVRPTGALSEREHGDVLAWETLNLVDGKRTVSDIRDVLTGRYEPVSVREVAEYLELLGRAKVITWR